jgi:hypothetical protein
LGKEIKYRRIGVESYKSNGWVWRMIRTLGEGLAKDKSGTLEERVGGMEERYNNTYHMQSSLHLGRHRAVTVKQFPGRIGQKVVIRRDSRRGTEKGLRKDNK